MAARQAASPAHLLEQCGVVSRSLLAAARHEEECSQLAQLLDAATDVLQTLLQQHNNSALRLLSFALGKAARLAAACGPSASPRREVVDVPEAAASAAGDIQLALSALATALQHSQPRAVSESGAAAPRASRRLSGAAGAFSRAAAASAPPAVLAAVCGSQGGGTRRASAAELQAWSALAPTKQQSKQGSPAGGRRVSGACKQLAHQQATTAVSASAQPAHGSSAGQRRAEAASVAEGSSGLQGAKLRALLVPGSVWRLADGGSGFECGQSDEPPPAADSDGGSSSASRTLSQRAAQMAWAAAQAAEAADGGEQEGEGRLDQVSDGCSSDSSGRVQSSACSAEPEVGAGTLQLHHEEVESEQEELADSGHSCSSTLASAEGAATLEAAAARQESSGWPLGWQWQAREHAGDESDEEAESGASGGPGPASSEQQEPGPEQAHVAPVCTAGSEQVVRSSSSSTAAQDAAPGTCSPVAQQLLQRGNAAFATGSYAAAAQAYQEALDALSSCDAGGERQRLLWLKLSLNLACCHLRRGHLRHCVAACDSLLEGDPSVFTVSMHCSEQSFPLVQPPSDWDIGLPAGTGDGEYLQVLRDTLPVLLQRVQPELVLYNAGVNVHRDDQLGPLTLSNEGISERERLVLQACLAARVPVAAAIGGGYEADHNNIVRRHLHLHRAAAEHMPAFGRLMDSRRAAARHKAQPVVP